MSVVAMLRQLRRSPAGQPVGKGSIPAFIDQTLSERVTSAGQHLGAGKIAVQETTLLCLGRFRVMFFAVLSAVVALAENSLVQPNDNRTPAGSLKHGVLELQLELRPGRWYPEAEKGPYLDVYAFAEKGHALQSSGPLIRVPQGTKIHATVRNLL